VLDRLLKVKDRRFRTGSYSTLVVYRECLTL